MSGGDRLSPFCKNFDLGPGWKEQIRCNAYHGRFLHFCLLIVNIKGGSLLVESVLWISNSSQDSRWTESSLFLLSLAALCKFLFCYTFPRLIWMFQAVWGGGKKAQVIFCQHEHHHLHHADCVHVMWPHLPLPPAQGGRGEPSPWTGWNPKEQFSRPPSRGKLKENLCNKTRRARRWTGTGREGSSSTGSPPPPSPPPPPSQSPTRFQAHSAHRPEETHVHRFEPKNLEYFPPCSICLTDLFLLPFISIHVSTFNSTKCANKI